MFTYVTLLPLAIYDVQVSLYSRDYSNGLQESLSASFVRNQWRNLMKAIHIRILYYITLNLPLFL